MSNNTNIESLEKLKMKFGRTIPPNVLEYFLKENKGNVDRCIEDLERHQWFKRRHTNEPEPTKVVDNYQRTNSQYLSHSQESPKLSSMFQHARRSPSTSSAVNVTSEARYPDVFAPHPPYLPNSRSSGPQQTNVMSGQPAYLSSQPAYLSSQSMPAHHSNTNPGYTKQLSEADKETILKHQRESTERAKIERENTVSHLEYLSRTVQKRNEELRTLKRENSSARMPKEDDMQMLEIIIDTLKLDIKDEEEKKKRKKENISAAATNYPTYDDWTCNGCSFINNSVMGWCDFCGEPRPPPPPAAQQQRNHYNYSSGGGRGGGYNYR